MDAVKVSAVLDGTVISSELTEEAARRLWASCIEDVFQHSTPEVIADWFVHTDPSDRNEGCGYLKKRSCLVRAAVDGRPLDVLEALKDGMTEEELAIAVTEAMDANASGLSSIVELVKTATNYNLRTVVLRLVTVADTETFGRICNDHFPEIIDSPDVEVLFSTLAVAILEKRKGVLDFITSRVSGEIFPDTPMNRHPANLLRVSVVRRWEDGIIAMARWLPSHAKSVPVDCDRPKGSFTALELYRTASEMRRTPAHPEIVAALTVHSS